MRKHIRTITLVTAIFCCALQPASGQDAPTGEARKRDRFIDGRWVLRIDRAILAERLGLNRRSEKVDESEYRPISKGSAYPILVSDRGAHVEIEGRTRTAVHPPMKGVRSSPAEPIVYKLDDGTFAGGRFVVWSGKHGLQGELTIYGSGVHLISSERGPVESSTVRPTNES